MKDYLIQLLDYEQWADLRIISALSSLTNVPERAIAIMGHVLSAQQVWYGRMMQEPVIQPIWEDIPVSWMIETAERQHDLVVSYVKILTLEKLNQSIHYVNSKGMAYQNTPLEILTHMSHHAAYHRGQIVQLIKPFLSEVPVTDFIVWQREK
jgi:uncharacterized damage-inducible protein DinB